MASPPGSASIGSSYQGPPKTSAPHYDITAFERDRAVRLGAIECSRDEIVAVFRRVRIRGAKVVTRTHVCGRSPRLVQPA